MMSNDGSDVIILFSKSYIDDAVISKEALSKFVDVDFSGEYQIVTDSQCNEIIQLCIYMSQYGEAKSLVEFLLSKGVEFTRVWEKGLSYSAGYSLYRYEDMALVEKSFPVKEDSMIANMCLEKEDSLLIKLRDNLPVSGKKKFLESCN